MTARQGAKMMLAAARDTEQSDSSRPSWCSPARQAVMHKRSACRCWPLAKAATHSGRQEHQASNQQQGKPHEAANQEKRHASVQPYAGEADACLQRTHDPVAHEHGADSHVTPEGKPGDCSGEHNGNVSSDIPSVSIRQAGCSPADLHS